MSVDLDRLHSVIEPVVTGLGLGLSLYDVELTGNGRARILRVSIEQPESATGVGIDELTAATRVLDCVVDDLVDGQFQLEISSPGLERPLRRPEHFAGAVGRDISVKFRTEQGPVRRERARLVGATATAIDVMLPGDEELHITHDAITAAHTVFEWGPSPRPGKAARGGPGQRTKESTRS